MQPNSSFVFTALLLAFVSIIGHPLRSPGSTMRPDVYTDSSFLPETREGWSTYGSYIERKEDSIILELILSSKDFPNRDWHAMNLIGRITQEYWPAVQQSINYKDPTKMWRLRIDADGRCYISLLSGPEPAGNNVVIPVQIKYRR